MPLKVLCAAGTWVQGRHGRERALVWLDTELLLLQLHCPRPQCSRVSKLPQGHCQGSSCRSKGPTSPSSACSLGSPQGLQAGQHPRRSLSPAATPRCVTSHSSTTASSLQLLVPAAEISFAVFEQNIGSVLLLFRKATGQMVKEYTLQHWASCAEPHAAGPGCWLAASHWHWEYLLKPFWLSPRGGGCNYLLFARLHVIFSSLS